MFSLKKLNEKVERGQKRKKPQKKQQSEQQGKKMAVKPTPAFISIEDDSPEIPSLAPNQKKKSKDKNMGKSWRFYNTLTEDLKNNEPRTLLETDNLCEEPELKVTKTPVSLQHTLKANSNVRGYGKTRKKKEKKLPKKTESKILLRSKMSLLHRVDNNEETELDAEMVEFYKALNEDNLLNDDDQDKDNLTEDNLTEDNLTEDNLNEDNQDEGNQDEDNQDEDNQDEDDVNEDENIKENTFLTEYNLMNESTGLNESTADNVISSNIDNEMDVVSSSDATSSKPYLCTKLVKDGSLLVALLPDSKIFLKGFYRLKLICGSISVLGYQFREGEDHIVCSVNVYSTLYINVLSGVQVKTLDKKKAKELNISFKWIKSFDVSPDRFVTVVKLSRYESNMTRLLVETRMIWMPSMYSFNLDLFQNAIGAHLIEDTTSSEHKLFRENLYWSNYLEELQPILNQKERMMMAVTGARGVGKSTFLKFMINSFLNNSNVPEVFCIDLDPGQSEFSLPSCLTLTRITGPLLGAACFQMDTNKFTFMRHMFLGDVSLQSTLFEYLDIVQSLISGFRELETTAPLIVNTMGFTAHVGFDIMIDILKMLHPTHVVTIESTSPRANYPEILDCRLVSGINRGIKTYRQGPLNYDLTIFQSVSYNQAPGRAKLNRNVNISCYLSNLWKHLEPSLVGETCKAPIVLDWTGVAIHVQGEFVPQSHVLQSINASLVVLCRVNPEFLEHVGNNLPLRIYDLNQWVRYNEVLGWGIVKGIDPLKMQIHILTPMDPKQVYEQVNVIAKPRVLLPERFQQLFSPGDAPYWKRNTLR